MPVEVTRRENETGESIARRFSQRVRQTGVLLQAKKVQYYERKKNRRKVREEAARKSEIEAERERLIKLGEIDEFSPYPANKKKRNVR